TCTFRPGSWASRSATVSPKNPEPTTSTSVIADLQCGHRPPRGVGPDPSSVSPASGQRGEARERVLDDDEPEDLLGEGQCGAEGEAEPVQAAVLGEVAADVRPIAHHVILRQRA